MPVPTLVGSAEAAKLLEIGPTNFSHLRKKMLDAGDLNFPAPTQVLQCGPIWTEKDMVKFKKHYDSRRRRVRSANGDNAAAATVETPKAPAKKAAAAKAAPAKGPVKARTPRKVTSKPPTTATVTDIKAPAAKRLKVKAGA